MHQETDFSTFDAIFPSIHAADSSLRTHRWFKRYTASSLQCDRSMQEAEYAVHFLKIYQDCLRKSCFTLNRMTGERRNNITRDWKQNLQKIRR